MHNTIALPTGIDAVAVRLQAPTLTTTTGRCHVAATGTVDGETVRWTAQADGVTLIMTLAPSAPGQWRLEATVSNAGTDTETRIAYPYCFYHIEQNQPVRIFHPTYGGVLEASTCPFDVAYPGPASFCLTAAAGLEHTLAVGLFNDAQRHVTIRHIPAHIDGSIRFVLERVQVQQGETVTLPVQFFALGADWAEAMAPYRDWADSAFPRRRERPDWFATGNYAETRQAHCLAPTNPPEAVAGIWIFDDQGRPRPYEQLKAEVDVAIADGKAHGYTPLFYQFGWWQNMATLRGLFMFDSLCGDYTAAHETTKRVVDYIHDQGARTYLYTNAISAGDETAVFAERPHLFVRDAAGHVQYNWGYPMLMFCPGAPGMREYWDEVITYILQEMDADGLFHDQVAGGFPPQFCYAPDHHHEHPDTYGRDFLELIEYIGQRARAIKPDAFIAGELVLDARSVLLDETHGPNYTGPKTTPPSTLEAQRTTPPAEYYIFTKYLCPQIYSSLGRPEQLMDGAAGVARNPLWRQYRQVFESTVTPCRVDPCGGLAYLYGPVDGTVLLAVRAQGNIGAVEITLPQGVTVTGDLPAGLAWTPDGRLQCEGMTQPVYFPLTVTQQ